jgi:hypothetical protein
MHNRLFRQLLQQEQEGKECSEKIQLQKDTDQNREELPSIWQREFGKGYFF